jgi:porin
VRFGCAFFCAFCLIGGAASAQDADPPTSSSLWTRPELLDGPGGPKQTLRNIGIDTDVWITQFYQGATEGSGSHDWEYAGKADLFATFDLHKWGLWHGLSVNLHQEWTWGKSVNFTQGTLLPVNTAWAWPTAGGFADDTSIIITQKFGDRVSATVGKFNMLDQAYKTPIRGGGGYDNFMHMSLTAPYTGVIPAYLIGGNLTIKTDPAIFSLFVYDPRNAQESDVIEHPFADGVTINGSVTVPVKIAGRTGYQGFKAVYTNLETIDFTEIPELFLPPPANNGPDATKLGWFLAYEFEQFLWQNPANPKQGIGVFGYFSLSQGNPNPLEVGWFLGISGTSFLPGRDNDRWGVMYFRDNLTPELKDSFGILGVDLSDESGWEVFYNYALTPWFRNTADAQFIEPGLSRESAVFLGLRNQIKF